MTDDQRLSAQIGVIGSLLIDSSIAGELFRSVSAEDFGRSDCRHIFEAARELYLSGAAVDALTIAHAAGPAYEAMIRETMRLTPTAANWKAYARDMREDRQLSELQEHAAAILSAQSVEEARENVQKAAAILGDRPGLRIVSWEQGLIEFLRRQQDTAPPNYLDWGFQPMNDALNVEPGDFVILGADSSVGKTAFALQLASQIAAKGNRVGFFSLETNDRKLIDRLVAQRGKIWMNQIKHKKLDKPDYEKIAGLGRAAEKLQLDIVNAAGMSVDDIRAVALARRYEIIFIDYVQLIRGSGEARWEIVTNISIALHTFAQSCGVTVVALSQISPPDKTEKSRRAISKDDLRESRQLKQDADVILLMTMADKNKASSIRFLRVDKNKEGALATMAMNFHPQFMTFSFIDTSKWTFVDGQPKIPEPEKEAKS